MDVARELLKLGARPRTADKVWHEAEMKLAQCMAVYAHSVEMDTTICAIHGLC